MGCALVALLARLPLLGIAPEPTADGIEYLAIADGALPWGTKRTPGYPLLLAVLRPLPGGWEGTVVVFQHAVGIALAAAVGALAARWFGWVTGVLAGLLAALAPLLVATERLITPDSLFAAAVFAGAALLVEAVRASPPSRALLAAAGGGFAAAAYLKPVAAVFALAALAPVVLARGRLRLALVPALVMALCLAPWVARNWIAYGEPTLSTLGGTNLFLRVFDADGRAIPTDTKDGRLVAELRDRRVREGTSARYSLYTVFGQLRELGYSEGDAAALQGRVARAAIANEPRSYVEGTGRELARFLDETHDENRVGAQPLDDEREGGFVLWRAGRLLGLAWWWLTLHAALALALLFVRRPEVRAAGAALVGTWLLLAVATALTTPLGSDAYPRYSAGGAALLWVAGFAGLVSVVRRLRPRGDPSLPGGRALD